MHKERTNLGFNQEDEHLNSEERLDLLYKTFLHALWKTTDVISRSNPVDDWSPRSVEIPNEFPNREMKPDEWGYALNGTLVYLYWDQTKKPVAEAITTGRDPLSKRAEGSIEFRFENFLRIYPDDGSNVTPKYTKEIAEQIIEMTNRYNDYFKAKLAFDNKRKD